MSAASENLPAAPSGITPEADKGAPPAPEGVLYLDPARELPPHMRTKANARYQAFSSDSSPDPEPHGPPTPPGKKQRLNPEPGH